MIKDFWKKTKKYFEKQFKIIKNNKIYLSLTVFLVVFIVFAGLSRLWQPLSYVSYFSFCLVFLTIGFMFQKKHKETKHRYRVAVYKQMLTEKDVKEVKRELLKLKTIFIFMYLIALSVIMFTIKSLGITGVL